jgi:undecaprenyl-phosphate 4-deoxy-4-formamido-L-arabinose transferase
MLVAVREAVSFLSGRRTLRADRLGSGAMAEKAAADSISVVIPVFSAAPILPELLERLESILLREASEFEVILVDDDSRDEIWAVIERSAEKKPWLRGIRLMRNFGQHNALLCGIRDAQNEFVVTMDDDLQHPPEEIPKLFARLREGFDVVYGTPEEERHGLLRDLSSQITKLALSSALGAKIAYKASAFRVFRRHLCEAFSGYGGSFVSIDVLLSWASTRFAIVTIRHDVRKLGASNYTFRKLVAHSLNMMTGFSVLPLQIASLLGFVLTFFGIIVLAYVLGRYAIQGTTVPGFPFLASIITVFSGAQLFALGVIGEYLARVHFRTMGRPTYAVRSRVAGGQER